MAFCGIAYNWSRRVHVDLSTVPGSIRKPQSRKRLQRIQKNLPECCSFCYGDLGRQEMIECYVCKSFACAECVRNDMIKCRQCRIRYCRQCYNPEICINCNKSICGLCANDSIHCLDCREPICSNCALGGCWCFTCISTSMTED